MINSTVVATDIHHEHFPRVSWGAILAGVVASLIIASLFNLLGLGLSLVAFKVDAEGMQTLGIGGLVWIIITGIVSMLIGGWVAGYFGKSRRPFDGALYGMVAWGISTMVTFAFLTTTVGSVLSGTAELISQTASAAGKVASSIATPLANAAQQTMPTDAFFNQLQQQGATLVNQQNQNEQTDNQTNDQQNFSNANNIQITPQLKQAITDFVTAANTNDEQTARDRLAQILTQTSGMTQDQAEAKINDWQQTYQQVRDQAVNATEQGTTVLGTIPLFAFLTLLLSGIAAIIGGAIGISRHN